MKTYRCKHTVEALRWDGESRAVLESWHEKKTGKTPWFVEGGVAKVFMGEEWHFIVSGEWLLWFADSGDFVVMVDEEFREGYEEVP